MGKNAIRTSRGEEAFYFVNGLLVAAFCILVLLPLLNVVALSLNDGKDAARGGIVFWPRVWSIDNFREIFENGELVNAYTVTIFRTVVGIFLGVLFNALAAYALKFKSLPGRGIITFIIFFTMLFGGGLIPYFILLKNLHLYNTIWVYVIPGIYSAWNILLLRTYMESLGSSLEESAKLDGAGDVVVFFKIIVPLSMPILAVIALYIGVGQWNDWFSGIYFVSEQKLQPMATVLQRMLDTQELLRKYIARQGSFFENKQQRMVTAASLKSATVIVTAGPIIFFYPFLQKYFVKGIMIGAIKG